MQTSEQINEIAAALAVAQGDIEGAIKGNTNPAFRTQYADLGAVWNAIREPLSHAGIAVVQALESLEGRVTCITRLMHKSGQWIESSFAVPVSKQDAQGFGSAATYARRYSLMAMVGIAPIDDDGNGAVGHSSKKAEATPPPDALLATATTEADKGTEAFRNYWKQLDAKTRAALTPYLDDIKARAARAEA